MKSIQNGKETSKVVSSYSNLVFLSGSCTHSTRRGLLRWVSCIYPFIDCNPHLRLTTAGQVSKKKNWEDSWKYDEWRNSFDKLQHANKCGQPMYWVFDICTQSRLKLREKWRDKFVKDLWNLRAGMYLLD